MKNALNRLMKKEVAAASDPGDIFRSVVMPAKSFNYTIANGLYRMVCPVYRGGWHRQLTIMFLDALQSAGYTAEAQKFPNATKTDFYYQVTGTLGDSIVGAVFSNGIGWCDYTVTR